MKKEKNEDMPNRSEPCWNLLLTMARLNVFTKVKKIHYHEFVHRWSVK